MGWSAFPVLALQLKVGNHGVCDGYTCFAEGVKDGKGIRKTGALSEVTLNTVDRAGFSKKVIPESTKAMKVVWKNQVETGGTGQKWEHASTCQGLLWLNTVVHRHSKASPGTNKASGSPGQGGKALVRAMGGGLARAHNHCTDFTSHLPPPKIFRQGLM